MADWHHELIALGLGVVARMTGCSLPYALGTKPRFLSIGSTLGSRPRKAR